MQGFYRLSYTIRVNSIGLIFSSLGPKGLANLVLGCGWGSPKTTFAVRVRSGGARPRPHSDHKCGLDVVCGLECGLECGLGAVWCGLGAVWCGLVRSGLPPTWTACALVVWVGRLVWSECGLSRALPDHPCFLPGLGPKP